jgi:hypothetical protein
MSASSLLILRNAIFWIYEILNLLLRFSGWLLLEVSRNIFGFRIWTRIFGIHFSDFSIGDLWICQCKFFRNYFEIASSLVKLDS